MSSPTQKDYEEYSSNCGELSNESRLVDAGLGQERVELNESAVRRCENASFEEYKQGRTRSMTATPLNLFQWVLFGGFGSLLAAGGGVVLRQELSATSGA